MFCESHFCIVKRRAEFLRSCRSLFWDYSERRTKQLHELANSLQSRFSHEPSRVASREFSQDVASLGRNLPIICIQHGARRLNDERYRQGILSVIHDALGLALQTCRASPKRTSRYDEGVRKTRVTSHPTRSRNLPDAMKRILRVRSRNLKKSIS